MAAVHAVGASSEVLPECAAANVLDDDLSSLWLSGPGMPQHLTFLLGGDPAARSAVTHIALRCWHTYQTNPRVLVVLSSADGIAFSARASVQCELTDRLQLFPLLEPVPPAERYVRVAIHSTHGGERTYLNRLMLRTGAFAMGLEGDAYVIPTATRLPDDWLSTSLAPGTPRRASTLDAVDVAAHTPPRAVYAADASTRSPAALADAPADAAFRAPHAHERLWQSPLRVLTDAAASSSRLLAAVHARRAALGALHAEASVRLLEGSDAGVGRDALRAACAHCARRLRSVETCARIVEGELLGGGGGGSQSDAAGPRTDGARAAARSGCDDGSLRLGAHARVESRPPSVRVSAAADEAEGSRRTTGSEEELAKMGHSPPQSWAKRVAGSRRESEAAIVGVYAPSSPEADAEAGEILQLVAALDAKLRRRAELLARLRKEGHLDTSS